MIKAAAVVLALVALPAAAQLHKCIGPDGVARYTDRPCETADKPAAIVAPPIAPPTARDAQAAEDRRRLANERTAALDAAQQRAAAESRASAIAEASGRVDRIKRENADPRRCRLALAALAALKRRDPVGWQLDVSSMELKQQAALYCGG